MKEAGESPDLTSVFRDNWCVTFRHGHRPPGSEGWGGKPCRGWGSSRNPAPTAQLGPHGSCCGGFECHRPRDAWGHPYFAALRPRPCCARLPPAGTDENPAGAAGTSPGKCASPLNASLPRVCSALTSLSVPRARFPYSRGMVCLGVQVIPVPLLQRHQTCVQTSVAPLEALQGPAGGALRANWTGSPPACGPAVVSPGIVPAWFIWGFQSQWPDSEGVFLNTVLV